MRMKLQDGKGKENQLLAHIKKTHNLLKTITELFLYSGTGIYNHAKIGLFDTQGVQHGIPRSCL